MQFDLRVRDTENPAGERGLHRAGVGGGDFTLGPGMCLVDYSWRLLDCPVFAAHEVELDSSQGWIDCEVVFFPFWERTLFPWFKVAQVRPGETNLFWDVLRVIVLG